MGQVRQIVKPQYLVTNRSPKYLSGEESPYLLNNSISSKGGVSVPEGANTPFCDVLLPAGENIYAGSFYAKETDELYYWTYNSNGVNFISRINSKKECEVVYDGCLDLSPYPKNKITGETRAYLKVERFCDKVKGGELKQLVWVNGEDEIGMLDVEASIDTDSFRTKFFESDCYDHCDLWRMYVPKPDKILVGEYMRTNTFDKVNMITERGMKFMYLHEYYDGRRSEWSDISTLYFQSAKGCFDSENGMPNFIRFNVPYGSPMVERVLFAMSEDGGESFYLYDTIEKYKKDGNYWYNRVFDESLMINEDDCTFQYDFFNDKIKIPLSGEQVTRVFNPHPRKVQTLLRTPNGQLGFVNYEKGVCAVNQSEVNKISVLAECASRDVCQNDLVEIKVKAVIYNFSLKAHGYAPIWFIYRTGGSAGTPDDDGDVAMFGFPNQTTPTHGQSFGGKIRNFVAYIEGMDVFVEMDQWRRSGVNNRDKTLVGVLGQKGIAGTSNPQGANSTILYYQEGSLFVRRGTKGLIRLTSHLITGFSDTMENSSTQVKGIFKFGDGAFFGGNLPDYREAVYEIEFDTCNFQGNVMELEDAFVIEDLHTGGDNTNSSAFNGYIYDKGGEPVEGARLYAEPGGWQSITDHNGFYSFYNYDGDTSKNIDVYVEQDCGNFKRIGSFTSDSSPGNVSYADYTIPSDEYANNFYLLVNVNLKDCKGNPVVGARIASRGGKYASTDSFGIAVFRLRNYYKRNRNPEFIFIDRNGCIEFDCNGDCSPCTPSIAVDAPSCYENLQPVSISMVVNTDVSAGGKRGLKRGGRYPFAAVFEGGFGKISAAYPLATPYLDIPKVQAGAGGYFCDIKFNILNDIILPGWVNTIKIVRGENIYGFVLQWTIDKVERIGNGKIKLTIQSLNDYNTLYNFNTNTTYSYVDGDRIEFIKNGGTTPFNSIINVPILSPFSDTVALTETKDNAAVYYYNQILISDSPDLEHLAEGAIIELTRNKQLKDDFREYFEIGVNVRVIDGKPVVYSGTFNTFDTFMVKRSIGGRAAIDFEHPYPTDFYKFISDDRGRVHFTNKFENESRLGRNVILNTPEQFNFFSTANEKTFDMKEHGDIVAINVKDERIGLAISESGNSMFEISDGVLKLGQDGTVRAAGAGEIISGLRPKVRGNFGLNYDDIGAVCFGDGYVTWIDAKESKYVVHNYSEAKEAAFNTQTGTGDCTNHFNRLISFKKDANESVDEAVALYGWNTGIDKVSGDVYLTLKTGRGSNINNAIYLPYPDATIKYSPVRDKFTGFSSICPDGYQSISDGAMVTFSKTVPYFHAFVQEKWNEFFGVPCDWIVGAVFNEQPTKLKTPMNIELQGDKMFFAKEITSGMESVKSEIPPAIWKRSIENKWNADFLNNINSGGGLFDGDTIKSYYIIVLFVRDNTLNLVYNSIDNKKRTEYSELDLILFKGMTVEQSGFSYE